MRVATRSVTVIAVDATTIALIGTGTTLIGTLAGALGGPWLGARQSAQHDRAARQHSQRAELYTDATLFAQVQRGSLDNLIDPYGSATGRSRPTTVHVDTITARMVLLAPPAVEDAWRELVKAVDILAWNLSEDNSVDENGQFTSSDDSPDVVRVDRAIKRLYKTTRNDLGICDRP